MALDLVLKPALWFNLSIGFSVLALLIAGLMGRGSKSSLSRLKTARKEVPKLPVLLLLQQLRVDGVASFVYYNTQV
jgi:hypothetical protein